jgi:hypothetical protein
VRVGGAVAVEVGPRSDQREYGVGQGAHERHSVVQPFSSLRSRTFMVTLVLLVNVLIVFFLAPEPSARPAPTAS